MLPDRPFLVGNSMTKCRLLVRLWLLDVGIYRRVLLRATMIVLGLSSRVVAIVAARNLCQFSTSTGLTRKIEISAFK